MTSPGRDTGARTEGTDAPSTGGRRGRPRVADDRRGRGQRRVTVELATIAALLAAGTALRWVDTPTPTILPALQALGPVVIPPLAALLLVTTVVARRWRTAVAVGGVLTLQVGFLVPFWIGGDGAGADADDALIVMASNLQYGAGETGAVVDAVRDLDVDVLVLLELTRTANDRLRAHGIQRELPYAVGTTREDAGGAAVLSRHPLDGLGGAPTPPSLVFETPAATVRTATGPVLVAAAHPVPPVPSQTHHWHRELAAWSAWAADAPDDTPLVLAGDFNATTAHPALRRFGAAGLRNAHREAGAGPVATWPRFDTGWPPVFHLDHILARGLDVADAGTTRIPGSDHDAVWAAFVRSG